MNLVFVTFHVTASKAISFPSRWKKGIILGQVVGLLSKIQDQQESLVQDWAKVVSDG